MRSLKDLLRKKSPRIGFGMEYYLNEEEILEVVKEWLQEHGSEYVIKQLIKELEK